MPTTCFVPEDIIALLPEYSIWIEAECWDPAAWDHDDGNTGVLVTFVDGASWGATFMTYMNVASLTKKNRQTAECMSGAYLSVRQTLLVDKISRERIEAIVKHLLATGEFEHVFERYEDEVQANLHTLPHQP